MAWYAVRHVVKWRDSYEERVTLWQADAFGDAIAQAEAEAAEYASETLDDGEVVDLFQAYLAVDDDALRHRALGFTEVPAADDDGPRLCIESGAEVFSLIRDSDLSPKEYIDRFFDSGTEHQGTYAPE